jgi:hypothetical protein
MIDSNNNFYINDIKLNKDWLISHIDKNSPINVIIQNSNIYNIEKNNSLFKNINDYELNFILNKIKVWVEYYKNNKPSKFEKPLKYTQFNKNTDDLWMVDFFNNINRQLLLNLIMITNYLGIITLFDCACAKIACLCSNKNEYEIRKILS